MFVWRSIITVLADSVIGQGRYGECKVIVCAAREEHIITIAAPQSLSIGGSDNESIG